MASFAAEITAIRAAYHAIRVAENDLNIARKERVTLLNDARERMVQNRAAIEGIFGTDHPLTLSLPALSPAPGSTPVESTLTGSWNAAAGQADLAWTASSDPNLDDYQVRMSPGATYDAATATVVATVPSDTLSLSTTTGLDNPGDVASFKVFVRLTTGNEAGSNTVTRVQSPIGGQRGFKLLSGPLAPRLGGERVRVRGLLFAARPSP